MLSRGGLVKHTAADTLCFVCGMFSMVTHKRSPSFQHDRLKSPGLHCMPGSQMDSTSWGVWLCDSHMLQGTEPWVQAHWRVLNPLCSKSKVVGQDKGDLSAHWVWALSQKQSTQVYSYKRAEYFVVQVLEINLAHVSFVQNLGLSIPELLRGRKGRREYHADESTFAPNP